MDYLKQALREYLKQSLQPDSAFINGWRQRLLWHAWKSRWTISAAASILFILGCAWFFLQSPATPRLLAQLADLHRDIFVQNMPLEPLSLESLEVEKSRSRKVWKPGSPEVGESVTSKLLDLWTPRLFNSPASLSFKPVGCSHCRILGMTPACGMVAYQVFHPAGGGSSTQRSSGPTGTSTPGGKKEDHLLFVEVPRDLLRKKGISLEQNLYHFEGLDIYVCHCSRQFIHFWIGQFSHPDKIMALLHRMETSPALLKKAAPPASVSTLWIKSQEPFCPACLSLMLHRLVPILSPERIFLSPSDQKVTIETKGLPKGVILNIKTVLKREGYNVESREK